MKFELKKFIQNRDLYSAVTNYGELVVDICVHDLGCDNDYCDVILSEDMITSRVVKYGLVNGELVAPFKSLRLTMELKNASK